jgi:hypothetical protein
MIERELGRGGLRLSAVGLGCMGMNEFYVPKQLNDEESIRVIHRYLDAGGNFLDTADVYGVGHNEALVGKAIRGRRDGVVVATKFGQVRGTGGEFLGVRGDPPYVRECCDASLRRLGVDVIDLYYQHRVDPKTPIETLANELRGRQITVNAVAPGPTATELFFEGKSKEQIDHFAKLAPLERLGSPEDIANVMAFLVGPDGGWVNGQVLRASGGYVWRASSGDEQI